MSRSHDRDTFRHILLRVGMLLFFDSPSVILNKVLSIFTLFFRNVAFFSGSVLAVLVVLTVIDEDVLNVEHVLTIMTIAGMAQFMIFSTDVLTNFSTDVFMIFSTNVLTTFCTDVFMIFSTDVLTTFSTYVFMIFSTDILTPFSTDVFMIFSTNVLNHHS